MHIEIREYLLLILCWIFTSCADHFNEENFYCYFNDFFDYDEYDENCVSDTLVY